VIRSPDRCATCRHFDASQVDPDYGLCRIDPLGRYEIKDRQYAGGWPVQAHDSVCGQHVRAEG
jgi:hypothetical protein